MFIAVLSIASITLWKTALFSNKTEFHTRMPITAPRQNYLASTEPTVSLQIIAINKADDVQFIMYL